MMYKKIILALLLFSFNLHAEEVKSCSVNLFSKIYRLNPTQTLSSGDIVYQTTCPAFVSAKIGQIISSSNGSVSAEFLTSEIEKEFKDQPVNINPRKTTLLDLGSTLRDQLTEGTNLYFLDTKSLNNIRSVGLVEGEQISANCDSCTSYGEKSLKIDISNPLTNSVRSLWFTSKVMAKVKVLKAKRTLSFQQKSLSVDDFVAEDIYSISPDNVLTSLENIHYYRPNRTIMQGSVVSRLDLQSVNLVNFGTPVTVLLKNQNINLQRTAMPTRSALFGETIELKGTNNKTIAGKVIDYNKVVIEL
jgi:flagella basal body P-ring formation protein FlgA